MLVVDTASPTSSSHDSIGGAAADDLTAFVGKNSSQYINHWRHLIQTQRQLGWHWGAAFFGCFWLLYRRMYLWFFIYFILSVVFYFPGGWSGTLWCMVSSIVLGLYGHWVYFQYAKHELAGVKLLSDKAERHAMAARLGGVDVISPLLFAALLGALMIAFFNVTMLLLTPWIVSVSASLAGYVR